MRLHCTTVNGIIGAAKLGQDTISAVARDLGCTEMGLYVYPENVDTEDELKKRIDGIIASLWLNDIVIMQYPTWNYTRFENCLIDQFKAYNTKLIIFVEDILAWLFKNETVDEAFLRSEIDILNRADVLILPSRLMHEKLQSYGLNVDKVVYQSVWDFKDRYITAEKKDIKRKMYFIGNTSENGRFNCFSDYSSKTPIEVYDKDKPERSDDEFFKYNGFLEDRMLVETLSHGGFGLVWSNMQYFKKYYCMNQPFKLGTYLAAGIPVIVRKGSAYEDFVIKNNVGFSVDSLEEASNIIQSLSDEEIKQIYACADNIKFLINNGFYTTQTLNEAIIKACEL